MGQKTKSLLGNLVKREQIEQETENKERIEEVVSDIKETPVKPLKVQEKKQAKDSTSFTKTFYLLESDIRTIESFVALRRMEGDLRYPNKKAVKEAFDLLRLLEKKGGKIRDEDVADPKRKNKSLNIYKSDFDYIEEIYKKRRLMGETRYTQADAIKEALILLRKKYPTVE